MFTGEQKKIFPGQASRFLQRKSLVPPWEPGLYLAKKIPSLYKKAKWQQQFLNIFYILIFLISTFTHKVGTH